jgi:prepilin-type N-terminal cleavage/methylation domain-containing protein
MRSGFSLLEVLIAMAITALLAAGIAAVVPSLQAYFERTPATIDLHQRGRTAIDAIAQAIRSADRVLLLDAERLMTIVPRINAAHGVLRQDQSSAGAALLLSDLRCPLVPDVCGFRSGTSALIADGHGRFDLFIVGAVNLDARSISARRRFDQAYAADADVVEVDACTFRLDPQPDGSQALVRETSAGAVQPLVDRVTGLRFEEALGNRGIDVTITLQPHGSSAPGITRRIAIVVRNQP